MLTSFYQRFVPAQIRSNFFFQKAGLIAEGLKKPQNGSTFTA